MFWHNPIKARCTDCRLTRFIDDCEVHLSAALIGIHSRVYPGLQLVFLCKVGKGHIPPDILLCRPDRELIEMGVVDGSETNGIAFEDHSLQGPLKVAVRRTLCRHVDGLC